MFRFFYNLVLSIFSILILLRAAFQKKRRIRTYFSKQFPSIDGPAIWIHAVSVGEARAVIPIILRLKQRYPDHVLVMTSVTTTGHEEVKRSLPEVDYPLYMPLDIRSVMRKAVAKVAPRLLIISETDYWYQLMDEVKHRGGKILVVNGKLSAKSAWWYHHLAPIAGHLFRLVDHFCVQDTPYLKRFQEVGAPADRIEVTGNLKLDVTPPKIDPNALRRRLKLSGPVITVGSTHDPEERLILSDLKGLPAKILLVPRHPERFDRVAQLLAKLGIRYGRYSQPETLSGEEEVILIDAMGVLLECYRSSTLAIVAGSYTDRVGGHNVIEPMWFGVPVIFGPYMHSQPTLCEMALNYRAALQLPRSDLRGSVERLLNDPHERQQLQEGGERLLEANAGAVDKTWMVLQQLLAEK